MAVAIAIGQSAAEGDHAGIKEALVAFLHVSQLFQDPGEALHMESIDAFENGDLVRVVLVVRETMVTFVSALFGGGVPSKVSSTHLPRMAGEVRVLREVMVKAAKVFGQRLRARIGQHPFNLRIQVLRKAVRIGERKQLVVGHRAPKKVGQPGCKCVWRQRRHAFLRRFLPHQIGTEQETRGNQARLQSKLDALNKARAIIPGPLHDREQPGGRGLVDRCYLGCV